MSQKTKAIGSTRPDPLVGYATLKHMWPQAIPSIEQIKAAFDRGEIKGERTVGKGERLYLFSSVIKYLEAMHIQTPARRLRERSRGKG